MLEPGRQFVPGRKIIVTPRADESGFNGTGTDLRIGTVSGATGRRTGPVGVSDR